MFPTILITFRETLEAALIIGIILSYLAKTKQTKYNSVVYVALSAGIVASMFGAYLFNVFFGGFEGRTEEIFEGSVMILGSALITSMIFWMMAQKNISRNLEEKVENAISKKQRVGLFLTVFLSVLREGIETIIFLSSVSLLNNERVNILGGFIGIGIAIVIGYLIFVACRNVNLRLMFKLTSILLILFAAGLLAHGVHELQEASVLPVFVEHLWDIDYILDENSAIGLLFKGIFGYNSNPSLIEVIVYVSYLLGVSYFWNKKTGKVISN